MTSILQALRHVLAFGFVFAAVTLQPAAFTLYGTRTLTAPTISALSVTTLAQAGRLKISGSSFGASQGSGIVTIGGATAPVSKWTDASITAYVPGVARTTRPYPKSITLSQQGIGGKKR